eukprot:m.211582 g.211582  ORF g.211582 m.211582 type:complete len:801 (-) comp15064_c0_seq2:1954-4356(-)
MAELERMNGFHSDPELYTIGSDVEMEGDGTDGKKKTCSSDPETTPSSEHKKLASDHGKPFATSESSMSATSPCDFPSSFLPPSALDDGVSSASESASASAATGDGGSGNTQGALVRSLMQQMRLSRMYELRFIMHSHHVTGAQDKRQRLERHLHRQRESDVADGSLSHSISLEDFVNALCSSDTDGESDGAWEDDVGYEATDYSCTSTEDEDDVPSTQGTGELESEIDSRSSQDASVNPSDELLQQLETARANGEVQVMPTITESGASDQEQSRPATAPRVHASDEPRQMTSTSTPTEIHLSQEGHSVLAEQSQQQVQRDLSQVQALSRVSEIRERLSQPPPVVPRQRPLRRQPPPVAPRPRRTQPQADIHSLDALRTRGVVGERLSSAMFMQTLSSTMATQQQRTASATATASPVTPPTWRQLQTQQQQPRQSHTSQEQAQDFVRAPDMPYVSRLLQPTVSAPANTATMVADQVTDDLTNLLTRRLVQTMLGGEYRTVLEVHLQRRTSSDVQRIVRRSAEAAARSPRSHRAGGRATRAAAAAMSAATASGSTVSSSHTPQQQQFQQSRRSFAQLIRDASSVFRSARGASASSQAPAPPPPPSEEFMSQQSPALEFAPPPPFPRPQHPPVPPHTEQHQARHHPPPLSQQAQTQAQIGVGANSRAIHSLRHEVDELSRQFGEMMSMVRMTYNLQLDTMRAVRQEVSAGLHYGGAAHASTEGVAASSAVTLTTTAPTAPPTAPQVEHGNTCVVCMGVAADTVMYRCGHLCACFACAQQLKEHGHSCPCCRAPVVDFIRVYRS